MIFGKDGMMQKTESEAMKKKDIGMQSSFAELSEIQIININGGSWLSYAIGYVLSYFDRLPNEDRTKYGGSYLETMTGRSSIM